MKTKLVLLSGALALIASGTAAAQVQPKTGFYGGIGIGKSHAKLNSSDLTLGVPGIREDRDESNTAYKFFGGYQFTRFIATELSYTDFGKFVYSYALPTGGQNDVNYKADSWASSLVATIPLSSSGFSFIGRVGVALNTAERSPMNGDAFFTIPPVPGATKRRVGLLLGVGGAYDFTPTLGMRLEFEHYGKFGEAQRNSNTFPQQTGRATVHAWTLNFIARF